MSSFNAQFDDRPDAYDALRSCWLNTRRQRFIEPYVRALPPGGRVLEIGAGTGRLLTELATSRPDVTFVGVEPLDGYVQYATARVGELGHRNVRFVTGVAEQLDPEVVGRDVDLVLTNDVLHHVGDAELASRAIRSVARPGTTWLAIEPSWINPYVFYYHVRTDGERLFFPRRFARAVEASGWQRCGTRRLFLIPSAIAEPPRWMIACERMLERMPVLSGGIAIELAAT